MTVESAADLAGLFETSEFAETASYQAPRPGVDPVPCSVIVDRGQARTRFRGADHEVETSERSLRLPAGAVTPERQGIFTMLDADWQPTGETFRVRGLPERDETGSVWVIELDLLS